jgi:hypothetical protein
MVHAVLVISPGQVVEAIPLPDLWLEIENEKEFKYSIVTEYVLVYISGRS